MRVADFYWGAANEPEGEKGEEGRGVGVVLVRRFVPLMRAQKSGKNAAPV